MSWESEESDCGGIVIHYNTSIGETKVEDTANDDTWLTPIGSDGTDDIAANIVPGFAVGKWMMIIGRKIKEALTE